MEVGNFTYNPKCAALTISHLAFADDMFVACGADQESLSIVKEALDDFYHYSVLQPNLRKSSLFFSGVAAELQYVLCAILPILLVLIL